jgi:uncharacterized protein YecT (DUF1311 family)
MLTIPFFLLAAVAVPSRVTAGPAERFVVSDVAKKCLGSGEAALGNLPAMEACINADYPRQKMALSRAYDEKLHSSSSNRRAALIRSQQKWLRSLNAKARRCAYPWTEGGKEYAFQFLYCKSSLLLQRRQWLARLDY